MTVNNRTRIYLATILLTLVPSLQAESLEGWYQIDVILFKPVETSLDAENWPEFKPSYPNDVIAVSDPRVFKLSQLEQVNPIAEPATVDVLEPTLGRDEFLFEGSGNSQRNRQMLDALAAQNQRGEEIRTEAEPETTMALETAQPEGSIEQTTPPQATQLPLQDPYGAGKLAYMRTPEDSTLNSILRSLKWSSRFNVLRHDSWIQPIDAEPAFILFQAGARYDDRFEVEGTLAFSRSRFLHVQSDLWYTQFTPRTNINSDSLEGQPTEKPALSEDLLVNYQDLLKVEEERGRFYPGAVHRMLQSRRMRSSELHYLDHPLFGVIVRISRYQPDRPEEATL